MDKQENRRLKEISDSLKDIQSTQEELVKTQNDILDRLNKAETVTDVIRDIGGSTWSKAVSFMSIAIILLIGIGGYYILKLLRKLPKAFG